MRSYALEDSYDAYCIVARLSTKSVKVFVGQVKVPARCMPSVLAGWHCLWVTGLCPRGRVRGRAIVTLAGILLGICTCLLWNEENCILKDWVVYDWKSTARCLVSSHASRRKRKGVNMIREYNCTNLGRHYSGLGTHGELVASHWCSSCFLIK